MTTRPGDAPTAERDAEALLDAVQAAVPSLAARAVDIAEAIFPDALGWDELERRRFEHQAADRLEAILRVTRSGDSVGDGALDDLAAAGAAAAAAGAPLPHILLGLRVSRDLLVQAAVRAAGSRGAGWDAALAVVLTKVLPVSDRLTDSVGRGYWRQYVERSSETRRG